MVLNNIITVNVLKPVSNKMFGFVILRMHDVIFFTHHVVPIVWSYIRSYGLMYYDSHSIQAHYINTRAQWKTQYLMTS